MQLHMLMGFPIWLFVMIHSEELRGEGEIEKMRGVRGVVTVNFGFRERESKSFELRGTVGRMLKHPPCTCSACSSCVRSKQ